MNCWHPSWQKWGARKLTDFKVGDKVKIVGDITFFTGETGEITKTGRASIWPYIVTLPNGKSTPASAGELELVKEPKFKVGDWVKVQGRNDKYDGTVGTVHKLDYVSVHMGQLYVIRGEGVDDWNFFEGQLVATEAPKAPSTDMVNGPSHYGGADNPYEAIKVAEAWGFEKNAYLFNALKYLARAEHKGRKVEDLKKLQFYVAREISLEEAK